MFKKCIFSCVSQDPISNKNVFMQRAPAYNPLQGHTGVVTSLVVAIDDAGVTTIMSGSRDKSVRLWDGVTGNVKSVIQGHASALTSVGFCNTLNGCTIVTGSRDNSVRQWDAVTGSQQKSLLDASAAADDRSNTPDDVEEEVEVGAATSSSISDTSDTSSGSGGVDATFTVSQGEKIQPGESVSVFSTGTKKTNADWYRYGKSKRKI